MAHLKLTVKDPNEKELDSAFVKKLMKTLYQDFELIDDWDSCGLELSELFTHRELDDISLLVNGNDWPSSVHALKELILVGEKRDGGFCPNCGHKNYYYTGGRMLCGQCEYSEVSDEDNDDGDIADYSGRVAL